MCKKRKAWFSGLLVFSLLISGLYYYQGSDVLAYGLAKPVFSVTKRTKKTATIKIKKNGTVTGYHIYLKTKKGKYSLTNFAINTRTVKLTKLKANQTYYVKIRAYRTRGSSVRKSAFSKSKKIGSYKETQKTSKKTTATQKPAKNTTATKAPVKSTPSPTQSAAPAEDVVNTVFRLVNEERAKKGLYAYTLDDGLCKMAGERAKELVSAFSHTRPNGENSVSILKENNYTYLAFGENIAGGQSTPAQVMASWMQSEGHRENILSKDFTKIGIGFYKTSAGYVYYWAQLFAR